MFEPNKNDETKEMKLGSRSAIWLLGLVAALVVALFLFSTQTSPRYQQTLDNVSRTGSAEFDDYKDKVAMEIIDKIEHPNLLGMSQYEVQARLTNQGNKPLVGIEMSGKIIGMDDKVIKESISLPIPRIRPEPLRPGESMRVSVKIDRPGNITDADVKDLVIELHGLKFQ